MENALGQLLATSISNHPPLQPCFGAEAAQKPDEKIKHGVKFQVACLTNSALHSLFVRLNWSIAPRSCRDSMQQHNAAERASFPHMQ